MPRLRKKLKIAFFSFFYLLLLLSFFINKSFAGILNNVPEIIQEQSNWCWAACSRATLLYYNTDVSQCTIADWARTQNSWGSDSCCSNPGGPICNQPDFMYGSSGSFQAILAHWGVNNNALSAPLSRETIGSEIEAGRPFEIRWGWNSGGGHFLVGRGIENNIVYYMDPWFGEGYSLADYDWIVSGGGHTWTHSLQITTTPGGTISGQVTRDSDNTGIQGLLVNAWPYSGGSSNGAYTDSNGNYTINNLIANDYRVRVETTGTNYASEYYNNTFSWSVAAPVSVTAGQNTPNINFGLAAGGSISGVIYEAGAQNAIEGATVSVVLLLDNWSVLNNWPPITTGQNGSYNFPGLPLGNYYVYAYKNGYTGEFLFNVTVSQGQTTTGQNIYLGTNPGSIEGNITDGTNILTGIQAEIETFVVMGNNRNYWIPFNQSVTNGHFIIPNLASNYQYNVAAYHPHVNQLKYHNVEVKNIPVNASQATSQNLVTHPAITISGQVTYNNSPISGINVGYWHSLGQFGDGAYTDQAGNFTLEYATTGEARVTVQPPLPYAWQCVEQEFTGDTSGVNFMLTLGATLSGVIKDFGSNNPITSLLDINYGNDKYHIWKQIDTTDGTFNFTGLPPGIAQIRVRPPVNPTGEGYAWNKRYIYLTEGETKSDFVIYLDKAALVTINAKDTNGPPTGIPNTKLMSLNSKYGDYDGWYGNTDINGNVQIRLTPQRIQRIYFGEDAGWSGFPAEFNLSNTADNRTVEITGYNSTTASYISGQFFSTATKNSVSSFIVCAFPAGEAINRGTIKYHNPIFMNFCEPSQESGSYSLMLPPNNNYDVYLALDNTDENDIWSTSIVGKLANISTWVSGSNNSNNDFTFSSEGGTVAGTVTYNGQPVLMADVYFEDASGNLVAFSETDQNGEYHIYNVPPGNYTATAWHPDYGESEEYYAISVSNGGSNTVDIEMYSSLIRYVTPTNYDVAENLTTGDQYYMDRTYTLTSMPTELNFASWIKTRNNDKSNTSASFLTFTLIRDAMVYVAYDSRGSSRPDWMSGFVDTGLTIGTTDVTLKIYAKFYAAGQATLGGNMAAGAVGAATNYLVAAKEGDSLALIKYVTPANYDVAENLITGNQYYMDRAYTLTSVPAELSVSTWIKTRNNDKMNPLDSFLTFTLTKDAVVYVAYDSRATFLPTWLSGFTNTGLTLGTTDVTLKIYAKFYSAGSVTLGGNMAAGAIGANTNYVVAAKEGESLALVKYVTPVNYDVAENLIIGDKYYMDRAYTLASVPSELNVSTWIKTRNNDKSNTSASFLTFTLIRDAMVYVAYDSRGSNRPDWMSSFVDTGLTLGTTDVTLKIYAKFYAAGQITLGGNMAAGAVGAATNYIVAAKESESLVLIKYVTPANYDVEENFTTGDQYYMDRAYTLTSVPAELSVSTWIKTRNNDKINTLDSFLTFTLIRDAVVYVAYDSRATSLPTWLSGFTNTGLTLGTTDVTLKIYAKFYAAGQVTLGGNMATGAAGAATNYLVLAKGN